MYNFSLQEVDEDRENLYLEAISNDLFQKYTENINSLS